MTIQDLQSIVQDRFLDIVVDILSPSPEKLRLIFKDKSFADLRSSRKIKNRFDFHWERQHLDGTIYRYDNFPDVRYKRLKTFPFHFHNGAESKVSPNPFSNKLPQGFIDFMEFVRKKLKKQKP